MTVMHPIKGRNACYRLYNTIRDAFGLQSYQQVRIDQFCEYANVTEDHVYIKLGYKKPTRFGSLFLRISQSISIFPQESTHRRISDEGSKSIV